MERQNTTEQIVGAGLETLRNSIYVCIPGSVVAYYPATQTADVQPMVNDPRADLDTGAVVPEQWQVVKQVRVAWPRFGGFTLVGQLAPYDRVILQAFDLDPSAVFSGPRSIKPVDPADVHRHGGGYWRCVPEDCSGPLQDTLLAALGAFLGFDGSPGSLVFTKTSVDVGGRGLGVPLALAPPMIAAAEAIGVAMGAISTAQAALSTFAGAITTAGAAAIAGAVPGDGGKAAFTAFDTSIGGAISTVQSAMTTAEAAMTTAQAAMTTAATNVPSLVVKGA
jgi:hypothetical protein